METESDVMCPKSGRVRTGGTIVAGHNRSGVAPPNWPTKPCLAETTTRPLSKGNQGKTWGTAYDPANNSSGEAPPKPPTQTCRFLPDLTGDNCPPGSVIFHDHINGVLYLTLLNLIIMSSCKIASRRTIVKLTKRTSVR